MTTNRNPDDSQRLDEARGELVRALSRVVGPLDQILKLMQDSASTMQRLSRLLVSGGVLSFVILGAIAYALTLLVMVQESLLSNSSQLADVGARLAVVTEQLREVETRTEDTQRRVNEQPKISVKPGEPGDRPSLIIEPPAATATTGTPPPKAVKIPIDTQSGEFE